MASPAYRNMPPAPANELEIPEYSSGRVLAVDQLENPALQRIADLWVSLKGTRRFPSRPEITPRNLGRLVRNVMLLRVLESDYEFRIVGDVQVQAYGESWQGMTLGEVALSHPKFAEGLKLMYDGVRMARAPFGYRGWIGRDMPDTRYSYHEIAFFPLGADEEVVDHLLVAGVYVPRGEFQSE